MKKLFVIEGDKTQVLERQTFDNEKLLQDILEKFPEVVALDELGVYEPFVVIGREVTTPAGYIDVLCMDGEGVLTVIETKLARNSQIRREVIGQIFEYVAQINKWRAQDVIQVANQYFQSDDVSNNLKNRSLLDVLADSSAPEEVMVDEINEKIDNNLRKGRIKVVIASDTIPETLRDTVNFINSYSNFDIFVLQVQSFNKDGLQIYAPTIYGFSNKQGTNLTKDVIKWNEERFFDNLSHLDKKTTETIKEIYEFTKENAFDIRWGKGKVDGTFSFVAKKGEKSFTVFSVFTSGYLSINFGNMKKLINEDELISLKDSINSLHDVEISEQAVTEGKYPTISISSLIDNKYLSTFISTIKKFIDKNL